jgi:hypothetical protein
VLGQRRHGTKSRPSTVNLYRIALGSLPEPRVKHRIFDDERLRRTGDEYLSGIAAFISSGKYLVRLADNFPIEDESSRLRLVVTDL